MGGIKNNFIQYQYTKNSKAPLLSWDMFSIKYNSLMEDATKYHSSVAGIKQIASVNKWSKKQTQEALKNIHQYVIVITDHQQRISLTGNGFQQMTGYTFEEVKGRNPNFLQGAATNKNTIHRLKEQLNLNETSEMVVENYRKNGELYLCKIIIKPVINIENKLVNYIAYEQEIAA